MAAKNAAFTKDELFKVERYLRRTLGNEAIKLRPLPRRDSAEVLIGDESMGILSKDSEDEDDITYHFAMAILAMDIE